MLGSRGDTVQELAVVCGSAAWHTRNRPWPLDCASVKPSAVGLARIAGPVPCCCNHRSPARMNRLARTFPSSPEVFPFLARALVSFSVLFFS
jgi:hypothetical protein